VVIGAGTAGLVTAAGAAGLGARVALVERHLMGGDCLNYGCVPSKALIRCSRAAHDAGSAAEFGVTIRSDVEVDFGAVMARMRRLRAQISRHDSAERFQKLGVDVFLGDARFTGADTVEVAGRTLRFARAVIATGARAARPPIEGLEEAGYLTNETLFGITERPGRLAVIGAGPIGCEMAQAFQRLGSEVTILHNHKRILVKEDPDASAIVQRAFEQDGIRMVLDCTIKNVRLEGKKKIISYEVGGKSEHVEADEILVGAGRIPNVEGLNLEVVNVKYDARHGVEINDRLQTANPRIYAAGDICMRYKFTHAADAAARIVIQNALFWGRKRLSALTIPWCTYTDPEIAHVGLSEQDAERAGAAIDTYTREFREVDRAVVDGETGGVVKVHLKKGTDKILGATIVARHAGEMISEITLAMTVGIGLAKLSSVIHPYPTRAEAIRQVGDLYNRTRLTPFVKKLFERILSWRR
jgi:pyruvate/2-oxoglutarate dehydrogenase complex dihydrolipoamide dehydrogenase (E3) component